MKKDKKHLYKIQASGIHGTYFFVTEVHQPDDIKDAFYVKMPPTEKLISNPQKTTKKFIAGVKSRSLIQPYWIVVP